MKKRVAPSLKKSLEEAAEIENRKLINQLKLQKDIIVPYHVWTTFGYKEIRVSGDQASFGEDFKNLEDLRRAAEYYVDQLGGTVKWEKK